MPIDFRDAGIPEAFGSDVDIHVEAGADVVGTDPRTPELPRVDADPKLTHRLVAGSVTLIGDRATSCTSPVSASGDRWCAFARNVAEKTELWVLNVTRATTAASARCDGTSADCLRLSADLSTRFLIWGPSHPSGHRFEGETLIFYAEPAPGMRDPYEGPVWAWRPGWASAQKLTSDRGVFCVAHPRSTAVWCVSDAVIEQDPNDRFDLPHFREFDLVAGALTDPSNALLPKVGRLTHAIAGFDWRVRFSLGGAYLAYSTSTMAGAPESVQVIRTTDIGKTVPTTLLAGAPEWQIGHDGNRLYFLKDYDRGRGEVATGTLVVADFPSGANIKELKPSASGYGLLGANDQVFSDTDRGLLVEYDDTAKVRRAGLMRDPQAPLDILELDVQGRWFQVATDLGHTLYMKPVRGNPVAVVARNDGSGSCQLTSDINAETYGERFTDSGSSVIWIEFGRFLSNSEEGWHARAADCGGKTKFGDYVLGYHLVGDDLVVFQGGDAADSTSWLQYTPLKKDSAGMAPLPVVIKEHPGITFSVVKDRTAASIVFTVSEGPTEDHGLYVHGPIPLAP